MANAFGNPITITATMGATWRNTAGNGAPANQDITIQKIIWDGATAAGTFVIQYGDGTQFLAGTAQATTNPNPVIYDFIGGRRIFDFKVTTLSSGTLQIFYTP
jgi:hypothetical protein